MRVSREWRNLQALKRSGLGHEPNHRRIPGDLALFCPTCPQPGINVPPRNEWLEEEKYVHTAVKLNYIITASRLMYRPSWVADGNFKLQHLAMRRPDDDVFLRDGQGHMVGREPYGTHIENTTEHYQVGFKFNHERKNPHISISISDLAAAIIER
jgi:hypothetical protein